MLAKLCKGEAGRQCEDWRGPVKRLSLFLTHTYTRTHTCRPLTWRASWRPAGVWAADFRTLARSPGDRETDGQTQAEDPQDKDTVFLFQSIGSCGSFYSRPWSMQSIFLINSTVGPQWTSLLHSKLAYFFNMFFSADLHFPMSYFLGKHHSPGRRSLGPWRPGCTRTQPGRWTCTGLLSAPGRSAALAPSGCIWGCRCRSPDLAGRRENSDTSAWREVKEKWKGLFVLNCGNI